MDISACIATTGAGGGHRRKNGELFINTYQGKLAEFGLFQFLRDNGVGSQEPDLSKWGRGAWDTVDLVVQGKKLNVKSTKSKGHLLLLETKDWDKEGRYIPNIPADGGQYDYFLLTRVHPDGDSILRSLRLYYSNEVNGGIDTLRNALLNTAWDFDIAGYVTASDLAGVIHDKIILERGSYLNKFTKMDADNYYVQSGDMKDVAELIELFRRN